MWRSTWEGIALHLGCRSKNVLAQDMLDNLLRGIWLIIYLVLQSTSSIPSIFRLLLLFSDQACKLDIINSRFVCHPASLRLFLIVNRDKILLRILLLILLESCVGQFDFSLVVMWCKLLVKLMWWQLVRLTKGKRSHKCLRLRYLELGIFFRCGSPLLEEFNICLLF